MEFLLHLTLSISSISRHANTKPPKMKFNASQTITLHRPLPLGTIHRHICRSTDNNS